jgi:hypothetical protein
MKLTVTLLATFAALTFFSGLSAAGMTAPHAPARPASGEVGRRLLPALSGGGFRMVDNWSWDGSVNRGPDGRCAPLMVTPLAGAASKGSP